MLFDSALAFCLMKGLSYEPAQRRRVKALFQQDLSSDLKYRKAGRASNCPENCPLTSTIAWWHVCTHIHIHSK